MVKLIEVKRTGTSNVVLCVGAILMLSCPIVAQGLQAEAAPLVERVQKEDGNFLGVHVP